MRTQMFGSFLLATLVACGGGGNSKPDAKIFLDAPIDAVPACAIPSAPLNGSVGQAAMRASGNFILNPTMGQYMGRTIFAILIGLPSSTAALEDSVEMIVAKPTTGGFPVNMALNFETNPMVMAPAARTVGFGDEDTGTMTVQNLYWPSSGTITFSEIAETNGSNITAVVSMTNYREIDENGADVPMGCTMAFGTLNLNLTVMTAFQPTSDRTPASPYATPGVEYVKATLE